MAGELSNPDPKYEINTIKEPGLNETGEAKNAENSAQIADPNDKSKNLEKPNSTPSP